MLKRITALFAALIAALVVTVPTASAATITNCTHAWVTGTYTRTPQRGDRETGTLVKVFHFSRYQPSGNTCRFTPTTVVTSRYRQIETSTYSTGFVGGAVVHRETLSRYNLASCVSGTDHPSRGGHLRDLATCEPPTVTVTTGVNTP